MHLVDVDDLKSLKPRVSVIWSGSSTKCRLEAPLFAIGTRSQEFIDHHKRKNHAMLPAPAIYALDHAEVHGLGAVCWDNVVLGGDGCPGLSSLDTPAARFFGGSASHYFQNIARSRTRRQIEGVAPPIVAVR